MIKRSMTFALCILLTCLFVVNSFASTQMMIGVNTAGIYSSEDLMGVPMLYKKRGEFINVAPFSDLVMSVHGHDEVISGYCDKNDLIYGNTLYFAEPAVQVAGDRYSFLVDSAKYTYMFDPQGLEFKNSTDNPMLLQQATFFKLQSLASALDSLGYKTVVTRAYVYVDENGTQDYATGSRLDFEIYAGSIKIPIPLPEYDENGELVAYSEIEQIFVDNGFVRIDTTSTFEDENTSSYLPYEVDFDTLSYVIMD